jgi:hypothetical protein
MSDCSINDELAQAARREPELEEAAAGLPEAVSIQYGHLPAVEAARQRIVQGDSFGGVFDLAAAIARARFSAFSDPADRRPPAQVVRHLIEVRAAIDSLPWPELEAAEPTIARVCNAVAELERMLEAEELISALSRLAVSLDFWRGCDRPESNRKLADALRRVLEAAIEAAEGGVA